MSELVGENEALRSHGGLHYIFIFLSGCFIRRVQVKAETGEATPYEDDYSYRYDPVTKAVEWGFFGNFDDAT